MIRIRGLTVVLGGRTILRDLDLDLSMGDSMALVGPNGAGKTTVLRCIVGLVRYEGSISIDGVDAARDPVGAKRLLGYMPQVPAFCEETAMGTLMFLARLRAARPEEIPDLLDQVGLTAHAHRRIRTFSTGMKQRLSLAAALLGSPPLLVLDEPTASLDLRGQREFVELLGHLKQDGHTLLLSSHRAEEIAALARTALVLDEGKVVASGSASELAASVWGEEGPGLSRALGGENA